MKLVKLGVVCGAFLLAACGGEDGATGPAGPAGPAGADGSSGGAAAVESVNGITPARSFPGRTVRMSISGDNTNWTESPTVTFDDAKITVSNVTVASPTSLVLEIKIGKDATIGDKTITVGDKAIKGFQIQPALDAAYLGSADQGGVLFAAFRNRDVENPFGSTSDLESNNGGVLVQSDAPESSLVEPIILIDVDATGTANVGVVDAFSGIESYGAEPLTIKARAAEALPDGETTAAIGANFASKLYSYDVAGGANGAFADFEVEAAASAPGGSNLLALSLGASGKWSDGFKPVGDGASFLARPGASTTGYLVLLDNSGAGGYSATVTRSLTPFAGKETEANDTAATANAIVGGDAVFAEVGAEADEDWFSITVPVNNKLTVTTKGIEKITVDGFFGPQDVGIDTVIEVFGSGDTATPIASSSDSGYDESVTTAVLPAGTYLIRVAMSSESDWNAGATAYALKTALAAVAP